MKKILKLLGLILCICMVFTTAFTGCGNPAAGEGGTASTATDTASGETKTAQDPYEVVWFLGGNGTEPNEKMVEEAMGEYLKDKINTTVDVVMFPLAEYTQKVQTIILSGEKADLVFTCSWMLPYLELARNGTLTEITDEMLTKDAPHAKEVLSGPFLDGAMVDGKLYTLPCNKEIGAQGSTRRWLTSTNLISVQ